MKPKLNLNNPIVQYAINSLNTEVINALNAPQTVEKAVLPIYSVPKRKGHQSPKAKAVQIGTGVLLNLKDNYFILGATHVFREMDNYQILTNDTPRGLIQSLGGERFSTGKLEDPEKDIYDASVFHIQSNISEYFKSKALTVDDIDFSESNLNKPIFLAVGFRMKKSNTAGNQIKTKTEAFPTVELSEATYKTLSIDSVTHIALAYEKNILVDGKWQISPVPRGLSGGAIIKVTGTDAINPQNRNPDTKQFLAAITTEMHREKSNLPGRLIGTRLNVHLGLICQFMPELKEYLNEL